MKKVPILLLLLCMLALPVDAHNIPDLEQEGSIHIQMCYAGSPVSGGELTLYRVGDIEENNGDYSFVLTEQFSSSKVSLKNVQSPATADKLADFTSSRKIEGYTKTIKTDGTVSFQNLQPGLYLLVQHRAAQGYYCVNSFLVSIPLLESGVYNYDVDASPKVSPVAKPQPGNPEQPKTGQSVWPIWTFSLSLAALAVMSLRRKRT